MDWRRRNDILDSKILSSFNTSSLLRPAEESLGDVFSALLLSLLIYKEIKPQTISLNSAIKTHHSEVRPPPVQVKLSLCRSSTNIPSAMTPFIRLQ